MYKRTSLTVLFILFFSTLLIGQDVPETKRRQEDDRNKERTERGTRAPSDTTGRKKTDEVDDFVKAEKDTSKLIPVESNLYWYNLDDRLSLKGDTSFYSIFQSDDEKKLIYKDSGDFFYQSPLWFNFALAEAGRPAYIGTTNLYPHQTTFYYNNILMNDYLQGMYNTQFIPVNYTQVAEADHARGNRKNYALGNANGIAVTSNSEQFQEPWTKILYKQGSYGYSDLDVSLAIPFSPTLAVQFGGTSRYFDGSIPVADFRGVNYRGEITWQYSPTLYFRGQVFLNRNRVGMANFDFSQKYFRSSNEEGRDDIFLDMTWLQNDTTGQRLHVLFYHSFYGRKFRSATSTYTFETKSVRYGVDANYNLFIGSSELLIGAGAMFPQILGDPFEGNPDFQFYNAYGKWRLPLTDKMTLRADAQLLSVKDFEPLLVPAAGLDYVLSASHFASIDVTAGKRLPNATERFWDFDTLFGNADLVPEKYLRASFNYSYRGNKLWQAGMNAGFHRIENEIIWQHPQFANNGSRQFYFLGAEGGVNLWKFTINFGGQFTLADINLTPGESAWGSLNFHDDFLNGALILDAYGTALYHGRHQDIMYQPRLDRFYAGSGQTDAFMTLNWKIVATIQTARIFFEMENAMSRDYQVVFGYLNYLRLFRFGMHWILWD